MNTHSLIIGMARQVDENKIQAIKEATINIVVSDGISGASISKIARKAQVSEGYLYRFYRSKRELLEILFIEGFYKMLSLLELQVDTKHTVEEIVVAFSNRIYELVETEHNIVSFHHKLLTDFSFEIPEKCKNNVQEICTKILAVGKETKEIDEELTAEQLYAIVVGGTLQFINTRLRNLFSDAPFSKEDIAKSVTIILRTMKRN